jgi:hypothetical protein
MKKISTERIDELAEKLNDYSLEQSEALLDEFANEQPDYFKYIMRDDFELLGDDEHELLLFTSMTLWYIIKEEKGKLEVIDADTIDDLQDGNWSAIENLPPLKGQEFDDYVEPIIGPYSQDELLYFVLDSFQDDEEAEYFINKESKVPLFVALKSFVDAAIEE